MVVDVMELGCHARFAISRQTHSLSRHLEFSGISVLQSNTGLMKKFLCDFHSYEKVLLLSMLIRCSVNLVPFRSRAIVNRTLNISSPFPAVSRVYPTVKKVHVINSTFNVYHHWRYLQPQRTLYQNQSTLLHLA